MNVFDSILVSINEVLGQFLHMGSSMSSAAALALGLFENTEPIALRGGVARLPTPPCRAFARFTPEAWGTRAQECDPMRDMEGKVTYPKGRD